MIKMLLIVVALVTLASAAYAACPRGTVYSCYQGMGGKVICSCR